MNEKKSLADMLVEVLDSSKAWIHMDAETNRPVVYLNDGEKRYCVKKVQVFDKESSKLTTQWINLGEVNPKDKPAGLDPNVVAAVKELIKEGKLSA